MFITSDELEKQTYRLVISEKKEKVLRHEILKILL